LQFINIGIKRNNIGIVSDENGKFSFENWQFWTNEILTFIGFEELNIRSKSFKSNNKRIYSYAKNNWFIRRYYCSDKAAELEMGRNLTAVWFCRLYSSK
jgi:hypothetical protein